MDSEGSSFPPPPPPPPPGSMGAIQIPTYKEQQQQMKSQQPMAANEDQYLNLPPQLLSTMNKDKKPFTYTPNSLIGEKGLLDLSQIKSPRMKKRLMENQLDDEEKQQQREQQRRDKQEQIQPPEQQKQYFPVSPPRKLNILQEVKEQQQYQHPEFGNQQQFQPATPPLQQQPIQPVYSPPIQQQPMYSTSMQQQPQFEEQQIYRNPPPPPIRQHETIASPPVCSTSAFPNLNKQPKPFQRFETPKVDNFPQYGENQHYFNITPPKKIDIYKETHEQPALPKTPVYVPTLQDQWQQRKQQQQQPVINKSFSQPRQSPIPQTPPLYDYAEEQKPIQSKSFKILQQIVKEDDQQTQWQQPQQQQQAPWRVKTQYDDKKSEMNTFRYSNSTQEHHEEHRERIIPIHIERQPQQNQQFYTPAAHQERIKTAPMYQGASFRLLQTMTDTEQQQSHYIQPQRVATGFEGTDF